MINQQSQANMLSFIYCSVNSADHVYAIDVTDIARIESVDQMRFDQGKGEIVGWMTDDMERIPVYSLDKLLGYPVELTGISQRVVIFNSTSIPWALLVNGVSSVVQISELQIFSLPEVVINPAANYFQGVIKQDDRLALILTADYLSITNSSVSSRESNSLIRQSYVVNKPQATSFEAINNERLQPSAEQPTQASSPGTLIMFSSGSDQRTSKQISYGLSLSQVAEVIDMSPVLTVPHAPSSVLGLTIWREHVVPVVDLDTHLGLATKPVSPVNRQSQLMIVRGPQPDSFLGFPTEHGVRSKRSPIDHKPCRLTASVKKDYVMGMYEIAGESLVFPDVRAIAG